ncbi:hypothetical protein A6769_12095 [Nostoc punctiforme NIES-2108]|uniref:Uncharacterized protein n=1 Tax=Nostoc punctiforme NIES-2108 TaxID=1356359 RepID=A0A367RM40_NOSPU|nr:hypothetical protein A6769_12095 [Nostoc punctiforme NIES-2108]
MPNAQYPAPSHMKITLKTATGDFVYETKILSLHKYPEVILWGKRVFTVFAPGVYWEAFFYVVPEAVDQ